MVLLPCPPVKAGRFSKTSSGTGPTTISLAQMIVELPTQNAAQFRKVRERQRASEDPLGRVPGRDINGNYPT